MNKPIASLLMLGVPALGTATGVCLADTDQPPSVQVALTSATVSQGEPVVLKYRIVNSAPESMDIILGPNKQGWLGAAFTDGAGHRVPVSPNIQPPANGIRSDGPRLDPGGRSDGYVVIGQGRLPVTPGQYRLDLSAHFTYKGGEDAPLSVYNRSYSLPLTVTPRDARRLNTQAQALAQTVLDGTSVAERQAASEALFSLPAGDAVPFWRFLIADPHLSPSQAGEIARHLSSLGSPLAADLLAQMAWEGSPQWVEGGFDARGYLQDMHRSGDEALKRHIEQAFAAHGERVPSKLIGMAR